MKKIIFAAAAASMLIASSACADAENVGDVIGEIYSTDILATVDNVPIPSYNIGGRTVIVLEDLRSYGFIVDWNAENKTLRVTTDYMPENPGTGYVTRGQVGQIVGNVLYTDIITYVNGIKINAYNIGGYTCACIEDLGELTDDYNIEVGYSDYNFNYVWDQNTRTIALNSFRFPELDGEKIKAEHLALTGNKEYELYTEGDISNAPYYGTKTEPKAGILAGIVGDGNGNPLKNQPAIFDHTFGCYSNYVEFDKRQVDIDKPMNTMMLDKDCLMCIPWNTSDITQVYDNDKYIHEMLDKIASYNKPTIIRFAAEMNVSNLGDSPTAYVKAFRHVADIIHKDYPQFDVMWSPNDMGALNRPMSLYYPGDEYVDWIGVSSFLKRDFLGNVNTTRDEAIYFNVGDFAWTTNSLKPVIKFMEENNINKPLAISEGGVISYLPYSDEDFTDWAEPRLRGMYWYAAMRYPQIKLITYFNHTTPGEVYGFDMSDKPNYKNIMDEAMLNGQYLLKYSDKPEFTFVKASGQKINGTKLPLYTYSYLPEEYTKSVSYTLDGNKLDELTEIPYKYELDTSSLSDGTHQLIVSVDGETTHDTYGYILTKAGNTLTLQ